MKNLVMMGAAAFLAMSAPTASAAQSEKRQKAVVEVSIVDEAGKSIALADLPPVERQRVTSLRNNLQQWGNQQQRVRITVSCKYPPLSCTITIQF